MEVGLFYNDLHRVKKAKPKCDYTSDPKAAKCKKKEVTKSKRARIQFGRCQNKEHYAKPYLAVKKMPSAKRDLNRKCGKEEEVRVRGAMAATGSGNNFWLRSSTSKESQPRGHHYQSLCSDEGYHRES